MPPPIRQPFRYFRAAADDATFAIFADVAIADTLIIHYAIRHAAFFFFRHADYAAIISALSIFAAISAAADDAAAAMPLRLASPP